MKIKPLMSYYTFKSNNLLKLYIPTRTLLETILLWSQNKMASTKLIFTFVIAFLLSLFISPSHSFWSHPPNDDGLKVSAIDSLKVNLSLYYDTLCQNCSTFIVANLTEVFNNDLITIINLRLVPWANAYINKTNNAIVCQHGPDECLLNTLEACAINVWPDVNKHYAVIYCFQFLAIEGKHKEWKSCFDTLGLNKTSVLDCYISGNGTKLLQKYADETGHLNPPHRFVPWLVVNNQPLLEDYKNFATYVCKAFKGSGAPQACKSLVHKKIN
ncbi:gamma-interferon-responsive lysosomal thiol protein-like [Quercus suber]|uniref:gamma-interferon-responsive lysosomal thiol protein-like n=1 Tax=Quercus suber TaxID=58331 RepID=UPI0032DEBC60